MFCTAQALAERAAAVVNGVIHYSEVLYYEHAQHRQVADISDAASGDQSLVLFRGMTGFEAAPVYLQTLESRGFAPAVFRSPSVHHESNHLRNSRDIAAEAVFYLLENPYFLDQDHVFAGHSAGGVPTYLLAALAKGADLDGMKEVFPALRDIPYPDLEAVGKGLKGSHFIVLSSPLNGVRLSWLGRLLNRLILEPVAGPLVTSITEDSLREMYVRLRKHPAHVLDGHIVSVDKPLRFAGGPASWAIHAAIQGGMRLFTPFLAHAAANDGIVPMDASLLEGPILMLVELDHLSLVEVPEGAHAVAELVEKVRAKRLAGGNGLAAGLARAG